MAVQTLVSAEEYLAMQFEHDAEWVDGEVIERPMPTTTHGWTQTQLSLATPRSHQGVDLYPITELRVKIGQHHRVIDFCVYVGQWPGDRPLVPPTVAIEILSEDESMSLLLDKMEDYKAWGVRHAWVVDPRHRQMYLYEGALKHAPSLSAPEVGLELRPESIFRK